MYKIIYSPKAIEDLQKLKRSEPAAYKKADKFIKELKEHPKTGTGHPEPLKGDRNGQWSRTITKKHRLIYEHHPSPPHRREGCFVLAIWCQMFHFSNFMRGRTVR